MGELDGTSQAGFFTGRQFYRCRLVVMWQELVHSSSRTIRLGHSISHSPDSRSSLPKKRRQAQPKFEFH